MLQAPRRLANTQVTLDVVDYTDGGAIRFTGTAPPASTVRVYVDNTPAGEAIADSAGQWLLVPTTPVAPGVHALRVDQLDPAGHVTARVELPFQRADIAPVPPPSPGTEAPEPRVVVQPGQNLWRLARAAYGRGIRYTVIYQANQTQIRNPSLIYPGQVFNIPGQPAAR